MSKNIKVLIVDDEKEITKTIERYLTFFEGIDLFTAESYVEALKIIESEEPKVIISDVNLGDGNGLDLIKVAHKYTKSNQIIMITGASDTTKVIDALELGAVDYIKKPLDMEELKQRLDEACSRYRRWEQLIIEELKKNR